jgi:hypothetical protein
MSQPASKSRRSAQGQPAARSGGQQQETLFQQRQSRRYPATWHQRLIRRGIMLAAIFLLLTASLDTLLYRPARFFPASQAPPPAPPVVLISSNLQAGAVSINGQKQPGQLPLLMRVPLHGYALNFEARLRVEAPPFQPRVCQLKLPDALGATGENGVCQAIPLEHAETMTLNGLTARPDFWVYLPFAAEDLPANQQQALENLLTQTLTTEQQAAVPVDAFIATRADLSGGIHSERATMPLEARAILYPPFRLPLQLTYCGTPICPKGTPETARTLPEGVWSIGVTVALRWRFSRAAGVAVSDVPFPVVGLMSLLLTYDSSTGWRVFSPSVQGVPLAEQRAMQLSSLLCSTGMQMLARQAGTSAISVLSDRGVEGCKLSLRTPQGDTALVVWRFGVLLAANAFAQALLPDLPVAKPLAGGGGLASLIASQHPQEWSGFSKGAPRTRAPAGSAGPPDR